MIEQERNERGKFARKGIFERKVRTIRLTDPTWNFLEDKADENDMSKADFLEALASGEVEWKNEDEDTKNEYDFDVDEVAEILKGIYKNTKKGSKNNEALLEVLELMGIDPDEE